MSPRVRAETRDGLITLTIQNATIEDSGVYRILVRNQASEITSSCTVTVYETIKSSDVAPIFTSSIKGRNFRFGNINRTKIVFILCVYQSFKSQR